MTVPFNNLQEISEGTQAVLVEKISDVIASGVYINGPKTSEFQSEFGHFTRLPHVIPVGNGTDAIEIALRALEVSAGDTVYTVANAGGYSTAAIRQVGATPKYIDVSPRDLEICPDSLAEALRAAEEKPRAVVVTHLYGVAAPIHEIVEICGLYGIPVLEDCAQAIGVRSRGQHVGTFGDVATFSFYPTKNLGGVGDAGAVATKDSRLADKISRAAQYGWSSKYTVDEPFGRNSRMDEIQATVLLERLKTIDDDNRDRVSIYRELSSCNPSLDFVHRDVDGFNAHLAVVRVSNRGAIMQRLAEFGIETVIHYPIPDHMQAAYLYHGPPLHATEANAKRILSLPCHPRLSRLDIDVLLEALRTVTGDQ